jgi:hypothetical protein
LGENGQISLLCASCIAGIGTPTLQREQIARHAPFNNPPINPEEHAFPFQSRRLRALRGA